MKIFRTKRFFRKYKVTLLTVIAWIIALILLFTVYSCSPIQRLTHFQRKYPYLFKAKIDTLIIHDTTKVVIPGIKIDTTSPLFQLYKPGGISINKENLHLNLQADTVLQKIYIRGGTDTITKTIIKEKKVPVVKYIAKEAPFNWANLLWIFIPVLFILGLLIWLKKMMK